jgi:molybdate transport system substrate-binding protein
MNCGHHGFRLIAVGLAGLLTWTCFAAGEVTVFAAASLSDALRELAAVQQRSTGDTVRLNLGASSLLARQIEEGAPADLFFSADEAKMDDLARAGLIETGTRWSLLSNSLVIVVAADRALKIGSAQDLAEPAIRRVAIAEPATVPAGIYAREYLRGIGLWEKVAVKVVPTENVRAALAVVESGDVDAGIVYRTDALSSTKVRIAFEVPRADGPKISYPIALVKNGGDSEAARRFLALLVSPAGKSVFAKYGFITEP